MTSYIDLIVQLVQCYMSPFPAGSDFSFTICPSDRSNMFPSFSTVLFLLPLSQFIPQSLALPANPIIANADQNPSTPVGWRQSLPAGALFPSRPSTRLGVRPPDNLIWPEERSGDYHVRFSHYKDHINYFEGKAVVYVPLFAGGVTQHQLNAAAGHQSSRVHWSKRICINEQVQCYTIPLDCKLRAH